MKDGENLVVVVAHSSTPFTPADYTSAQSTNCVVVQLDAVQAVYWAQAYHDADAQIDGYFDNRLVTLSGYFAVLD